jgi:hypothetical protein
MSANVPRKQTYKTWAEFESSDLRLWLFRVNKEEMTKIYAVTAGTADARDVLNFCNEAVTAAAEGWKLTPNIPDFRYCMSCGTKINTEIVLSFIENDVTSVKCKHCKKGVNLETIEEPEPPLEQFDVFISYKRDDEVKVLSVVKILKEKGIKVWIDREQIIGGTNLQIAMSKGIRQCRDFIPFFSDKYFQSEPCKIELTQIFVKEPRGRIIPVNIDVDNQWLHSQAAWPNLKNLIYIGWHDAEQTANAILQGLEGKNRL